MMPHAAARRFPTLIVDIPSATNAFLAHRDTSPIAMHPAAPKMALRIGQISGVSRFIAKVYFELS